MPGWFGQVVNVLDVLSSDWAGWPVGLQGYTTAWAHICDKIEFFFSPLLSIWLKAFFFVAVEAFKLIHWLYEMNINGYR